MQGVAAVAAIRQADSRSLLTFALGNDPANPEPAVCAHVDSLTTLLAAYLLFCRVKHIEQSGGRYCSEVNVPLAWDR